jgi:hypothetical protein
MGVVGLAEELEKDPSPNSVALMSLEDTIANKGKVRLAAELDGDEHEGTILKVEDLDPIFCILKPKASISHLHASRRVFEIFKANNID